MCVNFLCLCLVATRARFFALFEDDERTVLADVCTGEEVPRAYHR